MAFFSAASHELKTPVTILKGQLTGMLDGVGVYRDRDKYLLRSLQVTGRMENLIQEMLSISRMETGSVPLIQESVGLSELIENQLSLDAQLLEQRGQKLVSTLTRASTSSGIHLCWARPWGTCCQTPRSTRPRGRKCACGAVILSSALRLPWKTPARTYRTRPSPTSSRPFTARTGSRSRSTGGSGLGLYIVRMILQRHGAGCTIENTAGGVRVTVVFSP